MNLFIFSDLRRLIPGNREGQHDLSLLNIFPSGLPRERAGRMFKYKIIVVQDTLIVLEALQPGDMLIRIIVLKPYLLVVTTIADGHVDL